MLICAKIFEIVFYQSTFIQTNVSLLPSFCNQHGPYNSWLIRGSKLQEKASCSMHCSMCCSVCVFQSVFCSVCCSVCCSACCHLRMKNCKARHPAVCVAACVAVCACCSVCCSLCCSVFSSMCGHLQTHKAFIEGRVGLRNVFRGKFVDRDLRLKL